MRPLLYIVPRTFAITITVFFSVFVLEGFTPGFAWTDSLLHLIIGVAVLGATIISWKWPDTGGWLFLIIGVFYLRSVFSAPWWDSVLLGGIPLLTGFLFLAEGLLKDRYPDLWVQHVATSDRG